MDNSPWDEYVHRAKEYIDTGRLEEEEIAYKVEIGRKLAEARLAVLAGAEGWQSLVRDGIKYNILHYVQISRFSTWINASPETAFDALKVFWTRDNVMVADRIRAFCELLPVSETNSEGIAMGLRGAGSRMSFISCLLMGLDVHEYPPFRATKFKKAYDRTRYPQPEKSADEADLYLHALDFLDRFIEEADRRGVKLRHRLDAQSALWMLSDSPEPLPPPPLNGPEKPTKPDLAALARDTYLTEEFLREIVELLEDKKQVIFQGPPGTGKTYVAQALAECLAGSKDRVTLVQFHPSYAYEDFVQGFRPKTQDNGQPGFALQEGPLLRAASKASKNLKEKHFLVIDEINRGNLAKVFGELYFLLEYRNEPMDLQYSNTSFSLPENLCIIGTMNTADRSIALVDLALRRRFHFVEFHPDDEPVKGVLRRCLRIKAPGMEWVADVVERANVQLQKDRDAAIGPSYFMKDDLNEDSVQRIWKHNVLPYLKELLYGRDEELAKFNLDALRRGEAASSDEDLASSSKPPLEPQET